MFPPALSRNDRRIRTCRLRAGENASVHRLRFMMEEALRLASLPGESEGRVYYFRSVHVSGLPESGNRRAWLDAFQAALLALARNAVHGLRPDSHRADAVFFRSEQEACEALLFTALRGWPMDAWFWGSVSETGPGASAGSHATEAIAKLSRSEASWIAVAAVVFDRLLAARLEPVVLLNLISETATRGWLSEFGNSVMQPDAPIRATLRMPVLQTLERAAQAFGADNPRVIWLATLAVILASPAEMENGTAISRARATLRECAVRERRVADVGPDTQIADGPSWHAAATINPPESVRESDPPEKRSEQLLRTDLAAARPVIEQGRCFGEPTAGAGLYFLVNVIARFGIAHRTPGIGFLARFFRCVAQYAGIQSHDSILLWTSMALEEADPEEEVNEHLQRVWLRKIRRWCRRNGEIGLREIVRRPGFVTLTRAHLDVSLSIDSADIRIRRIGLDLDPGWLPWFGRVIHFHYRHRGELHG